MALVLARKKGQSLRIGEATVKIVEIRGCTVRVAVTAPRHLRVLRAELPVLAQPVAQERAA